MVKKMFHHSWNIQEEAPYEENKIQIFTLFRDGHICTHGHALMWKRTHLGEFVDQVVQLFYRCIVDL